MASHLLKVQTRATLSPSLLPLSFSLSPYKSHQPQELSIAADNGMASNVRAARHDGYYAAWPVFFKHRRLNLHWVMSQWAAAKVKGHVVAADQHGQLENSWNLQSRTLKGRRSVFKVELTHAGDATESSDPACMREEALPDLCSRVWPRGQTACRKINSGGSGLIEFPVFGALHPGWPGSVETVRGGEIKMPPPWWKARSTGSSSLTTPDEE